MAKDIQTLSLKVGATNTISQDFNNINAAIERGARKAAETLNQPFGEANRTLDLFEKNLVRTLGRLEKGFASERTLADLRQMAIEIDRLYTKMASGSEAMAVNPAYLGTLGRLGTVQQGIGLANQLAVPSLNVMSKAQAVQQVHGSFPASFIHGINPNTLYPSQGVIGQQLLQHQAYQRYISRGDLPYAQSPFEGMTPNQFAPPEYDLDEYFRKRQSVIARNAGIIISRHQRETGSLTPEEQEVNRNFNQRQQSRIDDYRFNRIAGSEREAARGRRAGDLEQQYRIEAATIDTLTKKYAGLNEEQQKSLGIRLRARQEAGYHVTAQQTALREVTDPWSPTNRLKHGRGSVSHALHFGSQNFAFGIEDFLIASQYGGVKAGIRASVNNMTAIMASMTGAMNPAVGASLIAGTAIAGAFAPSIYGALTGDDERLTLQRDVNRTRTVSQDKYRTDMRGFSRNLFRNRDFTSSLSTYQNEMDAFDDWKERRGILSQRIQDLRNQHVMFPTLRGTIQTELEAAEKEFAGMPNEFEAMGRANIAANHLERVRERNNRFRTLERNRMPEDANLARRQINGEDVDPLEIYGIKRKRLKEDFNFAMRGASEAERLALQEKFKEDSLILDRDQQLATLQFNRNQDMKQLDFDARMAGFKINPIERAKALHRIDRQRIAMDAGLNRNQRNEMLAAFDKQFEKQLQHMGEPSPVNMGVDVGSIQDAANRSRYFDRGTSMGQVMKTTEDLLRRMLDELIKFNKSKKPPVKAFRG